MCNFYVPTCCHLNGTILYHRRATIEVTGDILHTRLLFLRLSGDLVSPDNVNAILAWELHELGKDICHRNRR